MKRTLFLGFVMLILFPAITLALVLEDKVNNYRVDYPSDWSAQSTPNSTDVIKAQIIKDNQTGLQVRIDYNRYGDWSQFVDNYIKRFIGDMQGHWQGKAAILEKRYDTINGHEVAIVSIDFLRGDSQRFFFKHYLWPHGNKVYLIQSGTPFENRFRYEPVIDSIARSFNFIN
ncbi:MAG: hypothetical protein HY761_06075 [Candidatus Omnitrophica bacterium]|nr:hypothetical protein [Candidatus Omnitrophota bacterium]